MLSLLLMLADVETMIARSRTLTAPERGCRVGQPTDITVCGRRAADRFRVPFVGYEPGDPRAETVAGERQRLLHRTDACQDRRAIMVGCGSWGLGVTSGGGKGTRLSGRTLAP
ncbi:hypothetical protein [Sphingomonas rubra]|uniref:Uncharacterized protein n=1 Tax=Sphingomonas rubra TaxID=634430 RepID=A0A1I5U2V1_9SPHN|nr:hypothetical protein [Sphingomonas rubra]SFP89187.1 hypothetical protein SAMN04488241_11030 [Sphingomonas rubra]